jgi:predicted phosphoadenosine phosphosulfate sulfurtransferase
MRVLTKTQENVVERTKKRIAYLFDEFGDDVLCNYSGGKDSSVLHYLMLQEAKARGIKLKVMFLDQEMEWESTVEIMREIMSDPDVEPYWIQTQFELFNATSNREHFLVCWDESNPQKWVRQKEPNCITFKDKNIRFTDAMDYLVLHYLKNTRCAMAGLRMEESPARRMACKTAKAYKELNWGNQKKQIKNSNGQDCCTMYPLFDWTYKDIWKFIYENDIKYNKLYDKQFAYGIPVQKMRVSSLIHETAVASINYLQEFEPKTYEKFAERIEGIQTVNMFQNEFNKISKLPYMFKNWEEYMWYLLDNLIINPDHRLRMEKIIANGIERADWLIGYKILKEDDKTKFIKSSITGILTNDWEGIKIKASCHAILRNARIDAILKTLNLIKSKYEYKSRSK